MFAFDSDFACHPGGRQESRNEAQSEGSCIKKQASKQTIIKSKADLEEGNSLSFPSLLQGLKYFSPGGCMTHLFFLRLFYIIVYLLQRVDNLLRLSLNNMCARIKFSYREGPLN